MKISFVSFPLEKNLKAQNELIEKYGNCSPEEADFIVALGGDGFILKSLHDYLKIEKPIFGMNFGSVGFLMNEYRFCLLYTSPSPRDNRVSRMPSAA